jgi:mRNA-degrading endonuclease toxin of MazEF toxin-antitoxin module
VSPSRFPQLGSVIWAELLDANGFRKIRPGVVVTATAAIAAGELVRVVVITTRLPQPLPDDHVMLPPRRRLPALCQAFHDVENPEQLRAVERRAVILVSDNTTERASRAHDTHCASKASMPLQKRSSDFRNSSLLKV